mmetsp:Transcript_14690/g.30138  ORF Transcript_14690/g.30138 Transcript_14690/m.30138 type:complete len:179 (+) Transcript_14690:98-634(+)
MSGTDNRKSAKLLSDELFSHCLSSDSISEDGLREIIERHSNSNISNYQFFHAACFNVRVTEGIIRYLLEYFPDAASAIDENGQLRPLHFACINPNVTPNIVQLLIDAAPISVRSEDNIGRLPLHCLCSNNKVDEIAELEILKLLMQKFPEAIRHADNKGYLPIHRAAMGQNLLSIARS